MTWLLFGSWILQKQLWFSHSFQYEHRPFFKVTKSQVKSKFCFDSHGILQQRPRFRNFRGVAISKKKYIFAAAFFFLEEEVVQKLDAPKISAAPTKVGFVEGGGMCCFVFFLIWLHLKLPNRKLIRLPISRYHTSIWIKNRTCHFFSTFLPCSLKIKALPAPSAGTPASLPAGGPEAKAWCWASRRWFQSMGPPSKVALLFPGQVSQCVWEAQLVAVARFLWRCRLIAENTCRLRSVADQNPWSSSGPTSMELAARWGDSAIWCNSRSFSHQESSKKRWTTSVLQVGI